MGSVGCRAVPENAQVEKEARALIDLYQSILGTADAGLVKEAAAALSLALQSLERARRSGVINGDSAWAVARQDLAAARERVEALLPS